MQPRSEQPFQVLRLLLAQPGEVVTREQVRQALWPDATFVDFEAGLNSAVWRLREALGRFKRFAELPVRFNWSHHVQTFAASCFNKGMIAKTFQVLFKFQRELRDTNP